MQYEQLYCNMARVQQKEVTIAIQDIVPQERSLHETRKCNATRPLVSQEQSRRNSNAKKEVSFNTQNCVVRPVKAKILALRRKCLAIHKIVSQDILI